jgi:hypothetical protein
VLFALFVSGCLFVTPARADDDDRKSKPFNEPGIEYLQREGQYIQWLAGALIIAACLFIAFKNPHRSHLD